jgi:Tfp pilus assembly protein PilF
MPNTVARTILLGAILSFAVFVDACAEPLTPTQTKWKTLSDQGQQSFSNGDYATAEHYFLNALDSLRSSDATSPQYRQTLVLLTRTLLLENYYGTAEAFYAKLRKLIHVRSATKLNCEFAINLDDLADTYELKGNSLRDPLYLEHALELRLAVSGFAHPKCADTLRELANLYFGYYQYSKAASILETLSSREEADLLHVKDRTALDASTLTAWHDRSALAMNYFGAKAYLKADRTFKDLLLKVPSKTVHPELKADICSQLASMYLEQKKYGQAEKFCRAAISYDFRRSSVPMPFFDPLTFDYLILGSILARNGHNSDAEHYLRTTVSLADSRYGDHPATYLPRKALADFLRQHNRLQEADLLASKNQVYLLKYPTLADERLKRHWYISRLPPIEMTLKPKLTKRPSS